MTIQPPFSRRMQGSKAWVQEDWPKTARVALLHLLHELVSRKYVEGWVVIDRELRRISRQAPIPYSEKTARAEETGLESTTELIQKISWQHLFDFCERLHSHLAKAVREYTGFGNDTEETISVEAVRGYMLEEVQRIFLEENFGYSFIKGEVHQKGRAHTRQQMARAESTLGDPRLALARAHYAKATSYFENAKNPDYENAIKEAVCAVEAAAKKLFPTVSASTLDDLIKKIIGTAVGQIPKTLAGTITGLYAYRNSGEGVAHGGTGGGKVTKFFAEYVLAVAASQVILLHDIAASITQTDTPF